MPKKDGTILVAEIPGEAMRYFVESWGQPKYPHVVDLAMNQGNGACSCTDFTTRRQPAIDAGKPLFTRETQCKHLIVAHRHWHRTTLQIISEQLDHHQKRPLTRPASGWGCASPSIMKADASLARLSKPSTSVAPNAVKSQTMPLRSPGALGGR
jgi:hypothetical protein